MAFCLDGLWRKVDCLFFQYLLLKKQNNREHRWIWLRQWWRVWGVCKPQPQRSFWCERWRRLLFFLILTYYLKFTKATLSPFCDFCAWQVLQSGTNTASHKGTRSAVPITTWCQIVMFGGGGRERQKCKPGHSEGFDRLTVDVLYWRQRRICFTSTGRMFPHPSTKQHQTSKREICIQRG